MATEPKIVKYAFSHFSIEANKWSANCLKCNEKIVETKGTTSGFNKHLKRKHPDILDSYKEGKSNRPLQSSVTDFFWSSDSQYGSNHPQQQKKVAALVEGLIVSCGLPVSIVENPNFRKFMTTMDPRFMMPSRHHISQSMIPKMCEAKKEEIKTELSVANFVALTLDLWSDRRCHSFIAVTGHTFVKNTLQTHLLTFAAFKGSHTGVRIAEEIEHILEEFNIKEKVAHIVTDNASNMKKAFQVINELSSTENTESLELLSFDDDTIWQDLDAADAEHVQCMLDRTPCTRLSCFAHTLQLVVRDGIKKPSVYTRAAMGKCCKLANLSHESTIFREAFENTFGAGRSIPSTNSTRWNSLHRQIKIIVSLDQYKLGQLLREQQLEHLLPTPRDHAALTEFVNVLQAFAEATDLVQGDQYTTIGSVVPSVIALHRHLKDLHGLIRYQGSLVDALLQSLHIRFSGLFNLLQITQDHSDRQDPKPFSEMLYPMASVLDPTFGFLWLEADHPGSDQTKSKIREEIIDEIVNQVDLMCPREIAGPSEQQAPASKVPKGTLFSTYEQRRQTVATASPLLTRNIVQRYLDDISSQTQGTSSGTDRWGSVQETNVYKRMLPLLEKIFCIPATSAPVERVFSQSGLLMRPHRARMGDKLLSQLVFLKCNSSNK